MKFDTQKFLKAVRSAAGTVCEEAENVVRDSGKFFNQTQQLAKLKMEAAGLKSDRRERFETLGQLAYVIHRSDDPGQELLDRYNAICEELDQISASLEQVQEKISQAKGQVTCPNCGRDCPAGFRFCPDCSAPLPALKQEASSSQKENPQAEGSETQTETGQDSGRAAPAAQGGYEDSSAAPAFAGQEEPPSPPSRIPSSGTEETPLE